MEMDKNDFDIDFDFEKEYGVDPELFLASDDGFDYDQFLTGDDSETAEYPEAEEEQPEEYAEEESDDFDEEAFEEEASELYMDEEDDLIADMPQHLRSADEEEVYYDESAEAEGAEEEDRTQSYSDEEYTQTPRKPRRREKKAGFALPKISLPGKRNASEKKEPKPRVQKQSAFSKLLDAYMAPVAREAEKEQSEQVLDPLDPKVIRRRKRSKQKIFKEVYLPAIIAGFALFLCLSFVVGAAANWVRTRKIDHAVAEQEAQNQANAESAAEAEYTKLMEEANALAAGYSYDEAIAMLNDFGNAHEKYKADITAKVAELYTTQSALQEWKDTSTIPNLSFHVLIADPARAFSKTTAGDLAGSYNKNFVTTDEFSRILNQLYTGNYVLVDFDSFVSTTNGVDGNDSYFPVSMWLPAGKKPIMITETMVNYFEYMVDSNKDGEPDAGGHGFANRLVVDGNGDIKAAYVDASGNELVGNFDLVPILEAFIKEHPDFSYQGARATLAVTGKEGVFGYRTNTSYVATKGQSYYDEQVVEAKKVVEALREKGYTIASYTYDNVAYRGMSTVQIQAEMQSWANQCTPVLGDVKVMVFARASDIDAYSGTSFNVLYNTGFHYFMNNGTSPRVDINTTFVKQTRLMVTGESMAWYPAQFTSYFDCNMVLDLTSRGNVPKS